MKSADSASSAARSIVTQSRVTVVPGLAVSVLAITGLLALTGCSSHTTTAAAASSSVASSSVASASSSAAATSAAPTSVATSAHSSAAATTSRPGGAATVTSGEIPTHTLKTQAPVGLTATATFGNGVTATVAGLKTIRATAHGPGEISGPASEFTLTVLNQTARPIDLGSVTVTVTDAAGTPFQQMVGSPSSPLAGHAAAGGSAHGTYVFSQPKGLRDPITISFNYSVEAPVVLFEGNAQ